MDNYRKAHDMRRKNSVRDASHNLFFAKGTIPRRERGGPNLLRKTGTVAGAQNWNSPRRPIQSNNKLTKARELKDGRPGPMETLAQRCQLTADGFHVPRPSSLRASCLGVTLLELREGDHPRADGARPILLRKIGTVPRHLAQRIIEIRIGKHALRDAAQFIGRASLAD
jgi:hypothetical protein